MAEILGLGVTHYPGLYAQDADMANLLRRTLSGKGIPQRSKDPLNWPAAMREEWGNDGGGQRCALAFINTLMYLDADRRGFQHAVVPLHVNCYGGALIRSRGGRLTLSETDREPDPPAPSASACFDLGCALARVLAPSPWRVALIASSSWSHAFLTRKHDRIYPDHASDRARLEELQEGLFSCWRNFSREQLEDAGQQELLKFCTQVCDGMTADAGVFFRGCPRSMGILIASTPARNPSDAALPRSSLLARDIAPFPASGVCSTACGRDDQMMRSLSRREFACCVASLVACSGSFFPSVAHSQQPPRRIGVLGVTGESSQDEMWQDFRQALSQAGYKEGKDVAIEWRFARGDYDSVPALVTDLVERKVEVIVVEGTVAALAAKRATQAIPIVMAIVADPVGSHLVSSLARPGGNITGLSLMVTDMCAKRLQLLTEVVPRATRIAVLWNPATPWHKMVNAELVEAARSLSVTLKFIGVQRPEELEAAFAVIRGGRTDALYLVDDPMYAANRAKFIKLATKAKLPIITGFRGFVEDGALMSYSAPFGAMIRRSAYYVDRILQGAQPSDLPVEQPTTFEFVINLKAAKALGITLPESILLRADEVIK